mmetsp:Transcript_33351/g.65979  ORF Transcript_33351/g.65979 Transcript_33351/m.65979 type:complete len:265 (-) Transcript_33351:392-1186(-)
MVCGREGVPASGRTRHRAPQEHGGSADQMGPVRLQPAHDCAARCHLSLRRRGKRAVLVQNTGSADVLSHNVPPAILSFSVHWRRRGAQSSGFARYRQGRAGQGPRRVKAGGKGHGTARFSVQNREPATGATLRSGRCRFCGRPKRDSGRNCQPKGRPLHLRAVPLQHGSRGGAGRNRRRLRQHRARSRVVSVGKGAVDETCRAARPDGPILAPARLYRWQTCRRCVHGCARRILAGSGGAQRVGRAQGDAAGITIHDSGRVPQN